MTILLQQEGHDGQIRSSEKIVEVKASGRLRQEGHDGADPLTREDCRDQRQWWIKGKVS